MTEHNRDRVDALTEVKYVGQTTAEAIAREGITAEDLLNKRVSYRMLIEADTNPGVATKIRREHSLPWSITGSSSDDLSKRSDQIRGLQDGERAWVAASSGDWASDTGGSRSASGDGSQRAKNDDSTAEADGGEAAWRERSKPDPVTEVDGVDDEVAEQLAKAGITSVRSLATSDPESVSDVLGFDEDRVAEWVEQARERS